MAAVERTSNGTDDVVQAARSAGLRYVSDDQPGITRRRSGRGFAYRGPDGKAIRDQREIARIKALAIPPAYTDVWICPLPNGHLQATGRDDRGRKQYRYHPDWQAAREAAKFDRMLAFGRKLPAIRERVDQDMRRRGLVRERVLATVIRLLETTLIRVGNEEYAKQNKSFGLTTLRDHHVEIDGARLVFEFRGKGGKMHEVSVRDRRLARIVHAVHELPGHHLFQYIDENGERQPVGSEDVNAYLREISGEAFTAKDFRTWAGTVLASFALAEFERVDTKAAARRNIKRAIEQVAGRLGNTVAVCRKSYVHPEIIESYGDGSLLDFLKGRVEDVLREELGGLSPEEAVVLAFLQQRLDREVEAHPARTKVEQHAPKGLKAELEASLEEAPLPPDPAVKRKPRSGQARAPAS
ncbi:MAG TPA: DNA topoisomerase IB [Geminicoccaceae bacterium]